MGYGQLGARPQESGATGSFYDGAWAVQYLRSFAGTIAGGTSENQRNIVTEHVLGLPRGKLEKCPCQFSSNAMSSA